MARASGTDGGSLVYNDYFRDTNNYFPAVLALELRILRVRNLMEQLFRLGVDRAELIGEVDFIDYRSERKRRAQADERRKVRKCRYSMYDIRMFVHAKWPFFSSENRIGEIPLET